MNKIKVKPRSIWSNKKTTLTVFLSDKFIPVSFLKLLWLGIYEERVEDLLWQKANSIFMGQAQPSWLCGRLCPFFQKSTQILFCNDFITIYRIYFWMVFGHIRTFTGRSRMEDGKCRFFTTIMSVHLSFFFCQYSLSHLNTPPRVHLVPFAPPQNMGRWNSLA